MRITYHRHVIDFILFTIYTLSVNAQEASRCARVVAGRDTITDSIWYFTRSLEVRLVSPGTGSIIYYTLDGNLPGQQSTRYTRPLLLSASAVLNFLTLEPGRKETLGPSISFRRIAGVESITLFSEKTSMINGQVLSLFDSLGASPLRIPANAKKIFLEINRGLVTRVDSIALWFHEGLLTEISSIKISFSTDGKKFSRPIKYKISSHQANNKEPLMIITNKKEFRYLKIKLQLKKHNREPHRAVPLRLIQFFDTNDV